MPAIDGNRLLRDLYAAREIGRIARGEPSPLERLDSANIS